MNKEDKISIYLGCLLLIVVFTFSNPGQGKQASKDSVTKFETITIATHKQDAIFKATDIIETYDSKGKKLYTVTFKDTDNKVRFTCEVPVKYEDKLGTDVIYKGELTISYLDELYKSINYNNSSISELLKVNNRAQEVSNIEFLFSDYIVTGIKTENEIIEQYTRVYKAS